VIKNRVLRGIYGPKIQEVAGSWTQVNSAELCNLYSSPDSIGVIKSRRMRCPAHVTCIEEMRNVQKIVFGNLGGTDHLGDLNVDEIQLLKCILQI
jgi:hypothetical protein